MGVAGVVVTYASRGCMVRASIAAMNWYRKDATCSSVVSVIACVAWGRGRTRVVQEEGEQAAEEDHAN